VEWPSVAETEDMIAKFRPLGVDQQITEMDVSVYTDNSQSYPAPPRELLERQAYRYRDLFEVFKRHSDVISSVTTWGVADDQTWLDSFPVTRKDHPLLFDVEWQAKPAYWGVVDPTRITTTTTPPPPTCRVAYTTNQWPGGFQAEVKVTNLGAALDGWTLRWSYPDGQRITHLWNGVHTQELKDVTVADVHWNRAVPPGGTVQFGLLGTWSGSNGKPTAFTLNGSPCATG
jgi:endo-1,4-beta-xylanase